MKIELALEPEEKLDMVYVDIEKAEKIFTNLIGNALKFTKAGGRVLVRTENATDHVIVIVRDTGIGIAADQLPYIFDRFHQVDGSAAHKYEGAGLGLCIAKEFVELHHGKIEVESEPEKGTLFRVRLPKGKSHLAKDEIIKDLLFETVDGSVEQRTTDRRLSNLVHGSGYVSQGSKDDRKKDILIVEDNRDLASNIAISLAVGYTVTVAYNGREGLEAAHKKTPDLIISDVMMPEMDGHELLLHIKENEQTPNPNNITLYIYRISKWFHSQKKMKKKDRQFE
ncbi:MAG: ATP-binding protein [Pseudomonadota bacterium]